MTAAAPDLPPAYTLVELEVAGSTNDEAKALAAKGEGAVPDGTLVWARRQTAGRGRRGRTWESPEGNLYCSLVLRPNTDVTQGAQLGYVAALAIYDMLGEICEPGMQALCKWPNDVLLNDRKVAGILLEASTRSDGLLEWVVLGVGVNIAHAPEGTPYPATSLHAEGSRTATVEAALQSFARTFQSWCRTWLDEGFEPVRRHWLMRCRGLNEDIEVRLESETLSGTFLGIDERGALILRKGGTERTIDAGDVHFPSA